MWYREIIASAIQDHRPVIIPPALCRLQQWCAPSRTHPSGLHDPHSTDKRKTCWAIISTTFSILSPQLDRVVAVVVVADSAEIHQIERSWDNGWCGVRLFRSISRNQHRVSGCQQRWDPRFDWCRTWCTTACCSDHKRKSIWCPVSRTDGWGSTWKVCVVVLCLYWRLGIDFAKILLHQKLICSKIPVVHRT